MLQILTSEKNESVLFFTGKSLLSLPYFINMSFSQVTEIKGVKKRTVGCTV